MMMPGIAVGWFLTFSQLYIHECAPAHLRGIGFGVYQVMLSIGSIVGASVDYGTHSMHGKRAYQIPLAIFFVAPTIQAVMMLFFPERPRWLMVQGREAEAEKSLRRLRSADIDEHQFQAEYNEIRGSTRQQLEQNKKWLFLEMWRGTNLRRTLLSIAVVCFHCAKWFCLSRDLVMGYRLTIMFRFLLGQHIHYVLSHRCWSQEPVQTVYPCDLHGAP